MKYVENQVQTVGESMKKFYSNVVHDFLPPVEDSKPNVGPLVTEKQNDVLGTYTKSVVGIKGKHGHVNERKSFKEQGNASEGRQRQHSLPPNLTFYQQAESEFYSEGSESVCISMNAEAVHEKNVVQEESPMSRFSSPQDENSSPNLREQDLLFDSLDSPADEKYSGTTENSSDRDWRSVFLTNCEPEMSVGNVDFGISHTDETVSTSDDLSEEAKSGLSLDLVGCNAFYKNAEIVPEEDAANEEHTVLEGENTFQEKDSSELISCAKEQHQVADDSPFLQDENISVLSLANEDFRSNIQGTLSPAMLDHETGSFVVQMEETVCDNIHPSVEAGGNLCLEQHKNVGKLGISLEENVALNVPPVVEFESFSNNKNCLKSEICSGEQHPLSEEVSNLQDGNLSESSVVPTNENPDVTISDEFHPETSFHEQELRDLQEESLCDISGLPMEAEKDIDGGSICKYSDLPGQMNRPIKYAVEKSANSVELKSSSDLSLCSTELHLQGKESDTLGDDNLSNSATPLCDKGKKNVENLSLAMSVQDGEFRASQMDEIICSENLSSGLEYSNIYVENKITQAALNSTVSVESSNVPNFLSAAYTQKGEKSCSSFTDSSHVLYISSISSGSFSDLTYDNKAVNPFPGSLSRANSAVSGGGYFYPIFLSIYCC